MVVLRCGKEGAVWQRGGAGHQEDKCPGLFPALIGVFGDTGGQSPTGKMDLKKETTEGECKVRCWIDGKMVYLTLEELGTQVGEHEVEIQNYTLVKAFMKKMGVGFFYSDQINMFVPEQETLAAKQS
jgi:hypothetical protein